MALLVCLYFGLMTHKFGSGTRNSDLEVEPVNEPKKRAHKRVVKTGVELFLPADFILHEKLVAAVRRTNISPANLSTIVNLLIEIGGGNTDYVNTSYSYIQKHYTNITKEVSSTIKKTWTAEKNLFVHWDEKTTPTLNDSSKENLLSVSISGKKHKVLGVPH